jgi:predicted lysophospholipase L1 biosynthesis ABC-type transport system permease subunit
MNVAGLATAITLATELRTDYSAHVADYGESTEEHKALHTAGQLAATSVVPYNLATLLALVNDLTAKYTLHNTDAIASSPTYHQAQGTTHALAAVTAVTTLAGAITRLNDIKKKFNLHDADKVAHTTGSKYPITVADAALGAAIFVPMANVKAGDMVSWAILKAGSGTVTGVSAVASNGGVTFTFSADPQNDAIISYCVAAE